MGDNLEDLIEEAHSLYGKNSIYEVIDAGRNSAVGRMIEMYGPVDRERLEQYLSILDQVREWEDSPESAD